MTDSPKMRTVTLVLKGGHLIKLGGAVDVPSLIGRMQDHSPEGEIIDVLSSPNERLILRREALLAVMDNYATFDEKLNSASKSDSTFPVRPCVLIEDYLSSEEHQRVLARALSREAEFETSKVTHGRQDYRCSLVLKHDEIVGELFRAKIQHSVREIATSLGLGLNDTPSIDAIECQITAHRDGGFYRVHIDTGSAQLENRVLSYVYYFRKRPHSFFGGELKLYEPTAEDGVDVAALVKPKDNSIVFFASHILHEALPTYVPSNAFCDSRFTVNGWVRNSPVASPQYDETPE